MSLGFSGWCAEANTGSGERPGGKNKIHHRGTENTEVFLLNSVSSVPLWRKTSSAEDDRPFAPSEDAVLEVGGYGAGEDDLFDVLAEADQLFHRLAVADAGDILLDDRAFVELFGDVVGGGADDLDATRVGGVVGLGAGEGGEEGVVDVDHLFAPALDDPGAEHLHVAGENDEIDPGGAEQGILLFLRLLFGVAGHRDAVEGQTIAFCGVAEVFAVGDDQRHLGLPFAAFNPAHDVEEAVRIAGDEESDAGRGAGEAQLPIHLHVFGEVAEGIVDGLARQQEILQAPFEAHEEPALGRIDVLLEVENVAAVRQDEAGDGVDDASAVGTGDEQNCSSH